MYGIKITAPTGTEQTFHVEYDVVLVGSENDNNIILRDPTISPDHLRIDFEPEYVVVTDLNSETGTIIGITQLEPEQPTIWPEDQILYIGPFHFALTELPSAQTDSAQTDYAQTDYAQTGLAQATPAEQSFEPARPAEAEPVEAQPSESFTDTAGAALFTSMTNLTAIAGSHSDAEFLNVPYVIVNESDERDLFSLQVSGIPASWIGQLPQVMLEPANQAEVIARYRIPNLQPEELGEYPLEIVAYSVHGDYRSAPISSILTVIENPSGLTESAADFGEPGNISPAAPEVDIRQVSDAEGSSDLAFPGADEGQISETEPTIGFGSASSTSLRQSFDADVDGPDFDRPIPESPGSATEETRFVDPEPAQHAPSGLQVEPLQPFIGDGDTAEELSEQTELTIRQFKQDGSTDSFGINKDVLTIGSGESDDIRIDEVGVVPHHIDVQIEDERVYVLPRPDTPGVSIGRAKAPESEPSFWPPDKILQIGPYIRLGLEKTLTASALVELYPNGGQEWMAGGGQVQEASYIVANLGKRLDSFQLEVVGIPDEWFQLSPPITLEPGTKGELGIQFDVPERMDATAGSKPIQINAVGMTHGNRSNALGGTLHVRAFRDFISEINPVSAKVGEEIEVHVENRGNDVQTYSLTWHDTKDKLDFSPPHDDLVLSGGETGMVRFRADYRDGQPWFGSRRYPFKAMVSGDVGEMETKEGQFTGSGCLPMWVFLLPLLCFACIAIPALLQSRLDFQLPVPGFVTELFSGSGSATGSETEAPTEGPYIEMTRNASAIQTAEAEEGRLREVELAITQSWLELDDDADGLTNGEEQSLGTLFDRRDTDEDGIDDGEEVNKWLTSPLSKDTDSDGMGDLEEIRKGIDPRNPDTDGDGILDPQDPAPGQKPTPTPDATKTAVAIARATNQAGCYVDTGYDTLNLRSGPGEAYTPPLTKLPNGARLKPLAYRYPGIPQGEWIEVLVRGTNWRGWVSREWIKCNMEVTTLPSGTVPATPTVTLVPTATPTATETQDPVAPTATWTTVPPIIETVPADTATPTLVTTPASPLPEPPASETPVPTAEPTQPGDADLDSIEAVYAALKLADIATDKATYTAGEGILLTYQLVNTSGSQINVPQPQEGAQPLAGTRQHWVERLGADKSIPSLPADSRTGDRYRFRNEIIQANILFPDAPIPTQQTVDTTGFPAGTYQITIEYTSLEGTQLDSGVVEITVE